MQDSFVQHALRYIQASKGFPKFLMTIEYRKTRILCSSTNERSTIKLNLDQQLIEFYKLLETIYHDANYFPPTQYPDNRKKIAK